VRVYKLETTYPRGRFGTGGFTVRAWPILLILAAVIGLFVGTVLLVLPAMGQVAALGWRGAWVAYHKEWGTFILMAALAMDGLLIAVIILDRIYMWLNMPSRFRYGGVVWLLLILAFFGAFVWLTAYGSYLEARRSHFAHNPMPTALARNQSSRKQPSRVESLSRDAQVLLAHLDATASDTRQLRAELVKTLQDLQKYHQAVATTKSEADRLSRERATSERRLARLRQLLAGAEPITKKDLDGAQRSGWWQGIVLGLFTSIAGAYAFKWLTSLRKRDSSNQNT